ncbi:MAG: manganese efflux pump [Bacteroidaceae bacterium]|nr:manganese efflux pump [Bacteroidaceae bacterium]
MTLLEIILLAIALAMDCFAVSVTSGFILRKVRWRPILLMALLFGLFQGAMPCIGWAATNYFDRYIRDVDHWIAFLLLAFIGSKMLYDGFKGEEESHFNPHSLRTLVGLAVATSIDALAVGISFGCLGMNTFSSILLPVIIIGAVSSLFSLGGSFIGIFLGRKFHLPVEQIGGLILIGIGIKILIEHLFF